MPRKPAAGKKEKTPSGRSTPRRKQTERPKGRSGQKTKRAKGTSKSRSGLLLPFITVWLVVLVILAGLLYWGKSGKTKPKVASRVESHESRKTTPHVPNRTPEKKTATPEPAARPAPESPPTATHHVDSPGRHQAAPTSPARVEEKLASVAPTPERIEKPPKPEFPPTLAEIAIVIDDFGQNVEVAKKFLNIPLPITFSVLPFRPHSEDIVRLARSHGHEVILHLPMQPQEYPRIDPGRGALLLSMSSSEIQKTLQSALDAYPGVSGVNNHMGSRFTESADSMKLVLTELHRRNLYFLDSYTSDKSVGYSLARELDIPSRKRDIFLDHNPTEKFVRSQIKQLIRKAKIQGAAIAIGHPHDCTYKILAEQADRFRREGIAVVPSGKLIQRGVTSPRAGG